MALLFFKPYKRAVPSGGDSPFFYSWTGGVRTGIPAQGGPPRGAHPGMIGKQTVGGRYEREFF